jgi:hypothetical protein
MFNGFDKIVEERIKKALNQGDFDDLPNQGQPLDFSDENRIPEELRLAYKILKNAGFTPPELEMRKQIIQTEELLEGVTDLKERYRLLRKLNFLIMRLNSMRQGKPELEMPQQYQDKLAGRLAKEKQALIDGKDHA